MQRSAEGRTCTVCSSPGYCVAVLVRSDKSPIRIRYAGTRIINMYPWTRSTFHSVNWPHHEITLEEMHKFFKPTCTRYAKCMINMTHTRQQKNNITKTSTFQPVASDKWPFYGTDTETSLHLLLQYCTHPEIKWMDTHTTMFQFLLDEMQWLEMPSDICLFFFMGIMYNNSKTFNLQPTHPLQ